MYGLFSEYRSVWDMFYYFFLFFPTKLLQIQNNVVSLHRNWEIKYAQMAESVDALVSNTSGFTSIPVRPRVWVLKRRKLKNSLRFSFLLLVTRWSYRNSGMMDLYASSTKESLLKWLAVIRAQSENLGDCVKILIFASWKHPLPKRLILLLL